MITTRHKEWLDSLCRTYVVGFGKLTGHEHLMAYNAINGKILARCTSRKQNSVAMPKRISELASNKRGRVVIHHNHPRGSSLSREDLYNLAKFPGTWEVHAHGHQKQWYSARSYRERQYPDLVLAADEAFDRSLLAIGYGKVPMELENHLFNQAIALERVIDYQYQLDAKSEQRYTALLSADLQEIRRSVSFAVQHERSRK
jgi:hypothetical protein